MIRLALVAACGCSFIGVRPLPHPAPESDAADVDCTDRYTLPILDTAGAVVAAGVLGWAALAPEPPHAWQGERPAIGIPAAIALAITATSAMYGYRTVAGCRAELDQWDFSDGTRPSSSSRAPARSTRRTARSR